MGVDRIYKGLQDFIEGTYHTLDERVDRSNPDDFQEEYFRQKVQTCGGGIEFVVSPLIYGVLDNPLGIYFATVPAVFMFFDGISRANQGHGVIAHTRYLLGRTNPLRKSSL
tara:strand:- start:1452 stop:1784 length:333 start_codon:yes stop_codon:yes gene_type:complete